jgi:ribosome recycling factor
MTMRVFLKDQKLEVKLQALTDSHINKVDKMLEGKIKELNTI